MLDMRHGKCALCGCEEIIEAPARDSYGPSAEFFKPMSVAVEPEGVLTLTPQKRIAPITMYVCRKCGFVQWFAADPKKIPIDDDHATRLVERYDEGETVDGDEDDESEEDGEDEEEADDE
jgi:hypothetical protein